MEDWRGYRIKCRQSRAYGKNRQACNQKDQVQSNKCRQRIHKLKKWTVGIEFHNVLPPGNPMVNNLLQRYRFYSLILYRKNFTVYSKNHILGTAKNSDFSFVYELILKFP